MNLRPPCKTMKCISYPVCVNKKRIDCQILREHFEYAMKEYLALSNRTSKTWGGINLVLPNVTTIKGERNIQSHHDQGKRTTFAIDKTYLKPFTHTMKGRTIVHESTITEYDK